MSILHDDEFPIHKFEAYRGGEQYCTYSIVGCFGSEMCLKERNDSIHFTEAPEESTVNGAVEGWQLNTYYNRRKMILDSNGNIQQLFFFRKFE